MGWLMIKSALNWIALQVNGRQVNDSGADVEAVTIDSRNVPANALFVAIHGERFDGHDYAEQAIKAGAVALMTERELPLDVPQIVVADTRLALGSLAAAVKGKVAPFTVALTGSSGKTTVKEMCAAILRQRGNVLATKGNFNNDIGVPLTLLSLQGNEQFAVIELGANHQGEIAYTSQLVRPDVALINNISPAHIEGFGSLQGIATAKSEIAAGLTPNGVMYTNADSPFSEFWAEQYKGLDHRQFGLKSTASIRAEDIQMDESGCPVFTLHVNEQIHVVRIPLPGMHNVSNALAAAALCTAAGASLQEVAAGLAALQPVAGRMYVRTLAQGRRLIDDTYNANVGSVKAAIDALSGYSGKRVLVLGDLGELGERATQYHSEIGEYAKHSGIDDLFTVGVLSANAQQAFNGASNHHFTLQEALISALQECMTQANEITILIKGSRSARMEQVVAALEESEQARVAGKLGASTC